MNVRSFSSRLALVFAVLFTIVQVCVLLLVDRMSARIARERSAQELRVGERVFVRVLDQNRRRLLQAAELLSKDLAFRQAVASGDALATSSVMHHHGVRIQANVMMLISAHGSLIVDSLHPGYGRRPFGRRSLIPSAKRRGSASGIMTIDNRLYQIVIVPVSQAEASAFVAMGFLIDDAFLADLRALTSLHVSLLDKDAEGRWKVFATTQQGAEVDDLVTAISTRAQDTDVPLRLREYDTTFAALSKEGNDAIKVAVQRSISAGMEPFERLKSLLMLLTVASVAASIVGSFVVARRIAQPLAALTRFATRVRDGDYTGRIDLAGSEEIAELSTSFNHMLEGIAAREAEVRRLAYEDTLTSLPNRAMFNEQLALAVERSGLAGAAVSVLVMDLDRFKNINDTLGHDVGDQVLREVAARLRHAVGQHDIVARLGGDEFGILLDRTAVDRALRVARELDTVLKAPIEIERQPIDVGPSIGIAQCPVHGESAGTLLRNADIAMYVAKQHKSKVAVYEARYNKHGAEQLSLLSDLRKAMAENQLKLHYQPKVELRRSLLVGVEALVRWEHPDRGLILPAHFVPFAEQTGMIRELTRWVVPQAIRQCGLWHARGLPLSVSINVSTRDLLDQELAQLFASAARQYGLAMEFIIVEVTESALLEDPQRAEETMRELKRLGMKLSIDDYGTGYSSLAYIQRLHCDELKVDRTFVTHLPTDDRDAAIVRSTIELGHSLGLKVVGEGVEDANVMAELRRLGGDVGQGFGICRPLPAEQLVQWIAACEWKLKQHSSAVSRIGQRSVKRGGG
jgi:diguanylate cyclase (GGDEF)-like protein